MLTGETLVLVGVVPGVVGAPPGGGMGNSAPTAKDGSDAFEHNKAPTLNDLKQALATDVEGNSLTFKVKVQPTHGTLLFSSDGSYYFTPAQGFVGTDFFEFEVRDGFMSAIATASSAIQTLNVQNSGKPIPQADSRETPRDEVLISSVGENDAKGIDAGTGDASDYQKVDDVQHGTVTLNTGTGAFTYTPELGFVGLDSFTYTLSDGTETSNKVTVSIQVLPQLVHISPVKNFQEVKDGSQSAKKNGELWVSRQGSTLSPLIVNLEFLGSAIRGLDYKSMSGLFVVIPAGSLGVPVELESLPDDIVEPEKSVMVDIIGRNNIFGGCDYTIGTRSATVALSDNDHWRWQTPASYLERKIDIESIDTWNSTNNDFVKVDVAGCIDANDPGRWMGEWTARYEYQLPDIFYFGLLGGVGLLAPWITYDRDVGGNANLRFNFDPITGVITPDATSMQLPDIAPSESGALKANAGLTYQIVGQQVIIIFGALATADPSGIISSVGVSVGNSILSGGVETNVAGTPVFAGTQVQNTMNLEKYEDND